MSRVVVHIDSLNLRGVDYQDRLRVAAGIRDELARGLSSPAAALAWATAVSTRAPRPIQVRVAHDARPEQTGGAVGRAMVGPAIATVTRGVRR